MNKIELEKLAEKSGIDISTSVLGLPIERQIELAKKNNMALEAYQLDAFEFLKGTEQEETEIVNLRDYLEQQPLEKRYAAAGWCGRVYMDNAGQEEVLKEAGYSAKEIEEIIQADENNQIPA